MNKKLITAITVVITCFYHYSFGQQQVQFTQYMYNTSSINPAYTGSAGKIEGVLIHRSQWVGLSGAPNSQHAGINSLVNQRLGLGMNFIRDRIGPSNNCQLNFSGATHLPVKGEQKIAVGLSLGMDFQSVDWSQGEIHNMNDPMLSGNIQNRIRPLAGAGVYYYTSKWYAGASVPNFITGDVSAGDETAIRSTLHSYIIGGYVFEFNDKLKFKPAVLLKLVPGAPITADVSANFLIRDMFTVGASYRYNDAAALLAGFTLKNQFFLGYSYDLSLTALRNYNSGSHDIIFRYTFMDQMKGAKSPRFF